MVEVARKPGGDAESPSIHTSWLVLLFCRLLRQDSKSIVHWTVSRALELNLSQCPILEQSSSQLFISSIIEALTDSSLYARSEQKKETDCINWQNVSNFLNNSCEALLMPHKKAHFLQNILHMISQKTWSGVSLLYLSCAMSRIPHISAWQKEDFPYIRELIYHSQRTQEPLLRGAIQCYLLQTTLRLLNCTDVSFEDISGLLSVFRGNETLVRHTAQWSYASKWLSSLILSKDLSALDIESACSFCSDSIGAVLEMPRGVPDDAIKRVARILIILDNAHVISPDGPYSESKSVTWSELLAPVTYNIITAPTRPYLSDDKFLRSLLLYSYLLEESKGHGNDVGDQTTETIVRCLGSPKDVIHFIFLRVFDPMTHVNDFVKLKIHIKALSILSIKKQFHIAFMELSSFFAEECSRILLQNLPNVSLLQLWKALAWLCRLLFVSVNGEQILITVCEAMKNLLFHAIEKKLLTQSFTKPDFINDNISKSDWTKLTNEATSDAWSCVELVWSGSTLSRDPLFFVDVANQVLETLNTGPRCAVRSVFRCMKLIMCQVLEKDSELLSNVVIQGWRACLELRKSDLFRPSLQDFAAMIFQPCLKNTSFAHMANKYFKEFKDIGESSSGLFNIAVDCCCLKEFMNGDFDFTQMMVDCLTFGPIHRKDQRTVEEAVSFVIKQGDELAVNQLLPCESKYDTLVRVKALNFIRSLKLDNSEDQHFAMELVLALLDVDKKLNESHSVHFGNSLMHRIKSRVWQSILLLQPFLSQDNNEILLIMAYDFLASYNQQPSVRYLQEWLVFRIIHGNLDAFFGTLQVFMEKATKSRHGSIVSVLSIIVHLSHHIVDTEMLVNDWLPNIISQCMSQNFSIRIYSQVALQQFWSLCETKNLTRLLENYGFLKTCLQSFESASSSGNCAKNRQKLTEDFYFQLFDPVKDFTLQTVFYELPRLSNLTIEECISPSVFELHFINHNSSFIPVWNLDARLQNCHPSVWLAKSAVDADCPGEGGEAFNFQKKITPWTQMISDLDISLKKKPPISDGLIVVATLIDRAPNLGGLCRTSEVFGVSEFVIGNLKYIEDKQFQNLAVTANQWITIKEVKPYNLKEYLLSLKQKGYSLIGAEQTDDSVTLTKCAFPKKSVILLGNEKEGLPVDLIQVLDVCVQIPQQGLIRSLNVHVCGAILIWEYARQHIIPQNS